MKDPSLLLRRVTIAWIALTCCASGQFHVTNVTAQNPTPTATVASIPFEIAGENYVLIKARVNDSGPLTFLLDSGAGSGLVLYNQAAQALNLKGEGKGKGGGAGESTFETALIKGASLSFPGVTLNNQTFVVYPPDSPQTGLGRVVDGVIGYTLFSRYVVEIDYQSQVVNLYEPGAYQYAGAGESIPLSILSKVPFAAIKIPLEGRKAIEGKFIVDLGAGRFTLILNTPFVAANNLLAAASKTFPEPGAMGVGGEVKLLVGRLPRLQLGHFTLTEPVVHFAQDRKGAFANSDFSGVIGGELLCRFKVIFDYAHKRMILEPNANLADRFEYDMSGIRLRAVGPDFNRQVSGVVENSPASEAGIRAGDVISAIDGRPATEFSLSELAKMFSQEGKEYLLDIIRGAEKKQLKLKLRKLI